MFRKTPQLLAAALATAAFAGSASAASVLYVDTAAPDASWNTLVTSGGHSLTTFDTGSFNLSLNNQASIDYVNGFDVIIISNSNGAFNALRSHGALWNNLETPMINTGGFLANGPFSATSWAWETTITNSVPNANLGVLDADAPADPIFAGVTLTAGQTPDLTDGNSNYLDVTASLKPGVSVIASNPADSDIVYIARASAGSFGASGAEQYFIGGPIGGGAEVFTADGEKVFLNAITTLVPEPSSLALLGLGGLLIARRRRG